jgi:NADH dehydrogenase [ubiquinone] 1 alpha subcomplex assembly factor 2
LINVVVEWICWLNGQRKRAPTPEEMIELEARRERVKLNVALLKKEEEEKKARVGTGRKITIGN